MRGGELRGGELRGGGVRGGGDEGWRDEGWRDGKVNGVLRRLFNSKLESLISFFCCVRWDGGVEGGGWRGEKDEGFSQQGDEMEADKRSN